MCVWAKYIGGGLSIVVISIAILRRAYHVFVSFGETFKQAIMNLWHQFGGDDIMLFGNI